MWIARFGEEAGKVTGDGMAAAGHSANAFIQSTKLGTKAILKSTARKTAMGYVGQNNNPAVSGTRDH